MTDALETLASMYKLIWHNHEPTVIIKHFDQPAHCLATTNIIDDKLWFYDIERYIEKKEYLANASIINK